MAPSAYDLVNSSYVPSASSASEKPETITNIVFGLSALAIGGTTIWQGWKAWRMWVAHADARAGTEEDLELSSQELDVVEPAPGTPSQTAGPQQLERTDVAPSTSPPSQNGNTA